MKKLFVLLWTCIHFPYFALCQEGETVKGNLSEVSILIKKSNYTEAESLVKQTVKLAQKNKDMRGESDTYIQWAQIYAYQENFEDAMGYCQKALQIRKDLLHDDPATASTYNNMAALALDLGDPNESSRYLQLAISYCPKDSVNLLAKIYIHQGNILQELDSAEASIYATRRAISFFPQTRDTVTRIQAGYALAKKLIDFSRFEEGEQEIRTVISFLPYIAAKDSLLTSRVYEIAGVSFLRRPECQADSALVYLKKAEAILLHLPEATSDLGSVFYNIGEAYIAKNDLAEAKMYYQKSLELIGGNDENNLYNISLKSTIAKLESQMMAQDQERSHNKQIYWLYFILLIVAVTTLVSVILNLKKEKVNSRLLRQNFQLKHDVVKNGLITIDNVLSSGITELDDASPGLELLKKVRKMIVRMLNQVGYNVNGEEGPKTLIPFVKELEVQAGVIFPGAENYSYIDDVDDFPISSELQQQLTLIVSEAFMNIKKHAECTEAFFEVKVNEEGLTLKIEDDGKGFNPDEAHSRGLSNIEARVSEIDGQFKVISSPGNGTKIIVVVPSFPE